GPRVSPARPGRRAGPLRWVVRLRTRPGDPAPRRIRRPARLHRTADGALPRGGRDAGDVRVLGRGAPCAVPEAGRRRGDPRRRSRRPARRHRRGAHDPRRRRRTRRGDPDRARAAGAGADRDRRPGGGAERGREIGRAERSTSDAVDAITDPKVDAVIIVTPTSTHATLIEAALRAGKAIWSEKPIALDLDETARVVALWRETGLPVQMG